MGEDNVGLAQAAVLREDRVPAHRGRRLGFWACLAALHRFAEEGREAALLLTDDFRLPAIRTYLRLGFRPVYTYESHMERWGKVFSELGYTP